MLIPAKRRIAQEKAVNNNGLFPSLAPTF